MESHGTAGTIRDTSMKCCLHMVPTLQKRAGHPIYLQLQDLIRGYVTAPQALPRFAAGNTPTEIEAERLQMSRRQPVLLIRETTYLRGAGAERPGIYGCTFYRAARYHFGLE